MSETILERADAHLTDSIHKLSHAASAMTDAIDESVTVINRAVKRSGDAAEEFMDDTAQRVKRHPAETVGATLAVGLVAGVLVGWLIARK